MKKTFIHTLIIYILLINYPCLPGQEVNTVSVNDNIKLVEENLSTKITDSTKWTLKSRLQYYNIHGLSLAVVHDYQIEWAKSYGYANTNDDQLVTTETLFQAGSVSKSLNAMGLLKLVQNGTIDLYSDINKLLKSWQFPYDSLSKEKKITLANLLSHTAGLSVHGFLGYNINDTIPTLIQILNGTPPANSPPVRSLFEPSLKYQYSGGGTVISQLICVDNVNSKYDVFMHDSILNPIGMTNSFFTQPPPEEKKSLLATGYSENTETDGRYHIYPEQSAAGLWTNPTDLCKYIIEQQNSFKNLSNKALNQYYTKLMMTPYIDVSSAFGVFIASFGDIKYFYHTGADEGFTSMYIGSLDGGNGFAVMFNSNKAGILTEILNSVANVYHWPGFTKTSDIADADEKSLDISPNPATDFIHINTPIESANIEIYNQLGELIIQNKGVNLIDIRGLTPGLYLLKNESKFEKFIKF